MVANSIKRLTTKVERHEGDISAPDRMVITAFDIGRQCVFTGVTTRAVPAVVAECNRLSKGDVETERACDRRSNLGHF